MNSTIQKCRFYDKNLAPVQENAKKIQQHPVFKNLEHIQTQLNDLKKSHRRFIFAILSEKYGEDSARDLAQDPSVKEIIDNFNDLDSRTFSILDEKSRQTQKTNILSKLKHSFYYKDKDPKTIRDEFQATLKDRIPDILTLPKTKK